MSVVPLRGTVPTEFLSDIVKTPPNWWVFRQQVETRHSAPTTGLAMRKPSFQCEPGGVILT